MSKFRALIVSALLAASLTGGALAASAETSAKAPARVGGSWCC